MPPRKSKPRYLHGCPVLFAPPEGGDELGSGVVERIVSLEGPTYEVKSDDAASSLLQLSQCQLQFAPNTPVWVETKTRSMPGFVLSRSEGGLYSIQMMADNRIVGSVPETKLQFNSLQVAIQTGVEEFLVKIEAEEEHASQHGNGSDTPAPVIVKQEPGIVEIAEEPPLDNPTAIDPQNYEVILDSDDEDDDALEDGAPNQNLMTEEQLLEKRRQDLRRGYVLNEAPALFYSIIHSPQHKIKDAVGLVRHYIATYGIAVRQYGGIGPVLYQRCLHWHIRGQCRRNCQWSKDHVALSDGEAWTMEGALRPAMGPQGPIYPPKVVLSLVEEKKEEEAAAPVAEPFQESIVKEEPAEPPSPIGDAEDTTAHKRPRFECPECITFLLPASFGEKFYRGALSTKVALGVQAEYSCHWDLCVSPMSVIIQGDEYDKMEQSKLEIPRVLCRSRRLPLDLHGKLLWDLSRLRNQIELDFINIPHLLDPDKSCYMSILPVGETFRPNEIICATDALEIAERLREGYGPRLGRNECHIGVHLAHKSRDFSTVPSHIVIWSEDQRSLAKCRKDFFLQADTTQDDDECW